MIWQAFVRSIPVIFIFELLAAARFGGSHDREPIMYVNALAYAPRPRLPFPRRWRRGMGALDPQTQQIAGIAATGAATTAGILVSLGTIGGPVGLAIAGLASVGIALANLFSGCGDTCVAASDIANQVGQILTDNLNHYVGAPVRYRSMQAAALNNFDAAWAALVKACSSPALQAAGQNCIADRQAGACRFHAATAGQWTQDATGEWNWTGYGFPVDSGGVCWNYFIGMRDPIASDPGVLPDPSPVSPAAVSAASSSVLQAVGINPALPVFAGLTVSDLVLPSALLLLAFALPSSGGRS